MPLAAIIAIAVMWREAGAANSESGEAVANLQVRT
jgi:hypothetical protein